MGPITGSGGELRKQVQDSTSHVKARQRFARGWLGLFRLLTKLSTIGIKIKRQAENTEFHRHKWNAFVLIFGEYYEELEGDSQIYLRTLYNWAYAFRAHRVTVRKPVWMIYFHGAVINPNKE